METKSGLRTTEFWALIVLNVLPELGAIDVGDAKLKGLLHILTFVAYAIARGLAKQGVANVDPLVGEVAGQTEGVKAAGFEVPDGS
jgi:hypothetical protein